MASFLTLFVVLFAIHGSVTRKARLAGVVVSTDGTAMIASPAAGVLRAVLVKEGEMVSAGQALFEIVNERHAQDGHIGDLLARELDARRLLLDADKRLRHQQYQEKINDIRRREQNLQDEFIALAQEIELAQKKKALAGQTKNRFASLLRSGDVSTVQAQQTLEELLDATSRLKALQRNRVQLEKNRIAMSAETEQAQTSLETDLNRITASMAALQQEILENRSRHNNTLTAPHAGKVTAIAYQTGQSIQAGQMLAHLLPRHSDQQSGAEPVLEAHLYTANRTAGFIAPGQEVLLRYDAYPYQRFGLQRGIVTGMSLTPFAPGEMPSALMGTRISHSSVDSTGASTANEGLYRVNVKLSQQSIDIYGKAHRLKPGMTLTASVNLDRRAIWQWIVDPLLAVHRER